MDTAPYQDGANDASQLDIFQSTRSIIKDSISNLVRSTEYNGIESDKTASSDAIHNDETSISSEPATERNSEDDDDGYYDVTAPPPSPQEPSMVEAVFAEQLNRSLEEIVQANPSEIIPDDDPVQILASPVYSVDETSTSRVSWDHARALDKLLRQTQQEQQQHQHRRGGVKKKPLRGRNSRLKARSLTNKTAGDLADAISMIRISTTKTASSSWILPPGNNSEIGGQTRPA